ncbi:MAG: hypothetical protein COA47_10075 [Robiginitomaculum sp.]|nr:MAG: hypothetical protein COA47_10075 [Robiginitomaculum sp.]
MTFGNENTTKELLRKKQKELNYFLLYRNGKTNLICQKEQSLIAEIELLKEGVTINIDSVQQQITDFFV